MGTNINNLVYDGTTYNLAFSYAAVKAAHRTASLIRDPRGNPDGQPSLDTLVVAKGSSPAFEAKQILGAIRNGKIPESFDNDGSGVPAFNIIELKYLTNLNYWYMFDSSRKGTEEQYGFQFVESQVETLAPQHIVPKTEEIQYFADAVFDLGHNDTARMWVASKGDSSAPSS